MDASQLDLILGVAVEVVYILIIVLVRRKDKEEDIASSVFRLIREFLKMK